MTVPGNVHALMLGGEQGYKIERSLRFNSADSAYLNRTPASAGNRRTFTWSGWVKRSKLGDENKTFTAGSSGTITYLQFQDNVTDGLTFARYTGTHTFRLSTTQVFRDSSAWYHITLAVDTTQATDTNRVKIYVNGTQITVFTTATYPAQNLDLEINNTNDHRIGGGTGNFSASGYLDGYLTEINFIDGQALTPSSFGETDTITGVWKPKKYAGTYGTNGFYLNFSDNSGTTSTTLGKDSSGNSNNWTPNNFSVTAGAGNDSLIDTPTPYADGGNGRGNYCTLNPLQSRSAPSNGNLAFSQPNAGHGATVGTIGVSTGKWYWEVEITTFTSGTSAIHIGIVGDNYPFAAGNYIGNTATSYAYRHSANKYNNSTSSSYGVTYTQGDVIGVALDLSAGSITFYKNNSSQGVAYSSLTGTFYPAVSIEQAGSTSTIQCNFGQRPFAYTPPSGFVALNTQNLPEPSIKKPGNYFNTVTWTGNGSTQSITGVGFQPDLVWSKDRGAAYDHTLFDAVRGATVFLRSNSSGADETRTDSLTSFDSNGFSVGADSVRNNINRNGASYVSWCWDESATPGFDIVTFTAASSGNTTVSHSLGVAPNFILVKSRAVSGYNWAIYHSSIGNTGALIFGTNAVDTNSAWWNNTTPTSTQFILGSNYAGGGSSVAYLWSEVAGFSKFGSYTGNGSSDGPFVFCGFMPRWVMVKRTDTGGYDWEIFDSARGTYNAIGPRLWANLATAESSATRIDFLSNGFKIRDSGGQVNGGTIIFAAFAETPFRNALAR